VSDFIKKNFNVTFPIFSKVDVNGNNAHPVFLFLRSKLNSGVIKWNFTKFLVNRNGTPIKRYGPPTNPREIEKDLIILLENETSSLSQSSEVTNDQLNEHHI